MVSPDLRWPNDFESLFELQPALEKWVNDYNCLYANKRHTGRTWINKEVTNEKPR